MDATSNDGQTLHAHGGRGTFALLEAYGCSLSLLENGRQQHHRTTDGMHRTTVLRDSTARQHCTRAPRAPSTPAAAAVGGHRAERRILDAENIRMGRMMGSIKR
ncbi:hypothetical protein RJ55_04430 [Drechmeria coniospora]|nr:hypothetical protein RJ55_04430 [Drechmeria coniospora]